MNGITAWSGLIGALSPIWWIAVAAIFASFRPDYEFAQAISRLGEQGSHNGPLFQVLGFGGSAVLDAFFAAGLAAALGRGWMFRLVLLQVVTLTGTAIFPSEPGAPVSPVTLTGNLHNLVGLTYFIAATVLPFVAWRTFSTRAGWGAAATFSLVMAIVLAAIFLSFPVFVPDRWGIWQRLFAAARFVWLIAVAWRLRHVLTAVGVGSRSQPRSSGSR